MGIFLLSPVASVHAANTPTITLSATSATWENELTLTGSGFSPGALVTLKVGTTQVTGASTIGLQFAGVDSLITGNTPVADADGNFNSMVFVEDNAQGAVTVTAQDGTTLTKATTTFTMTASVDVETGSAKSGFPGQFVSINLEPHGFATGEQVTFASSAFTAAYGGAAGCTTGSSSSNDPGACTVGQANAIGAQTLTVAEVKGGSKAITATGGTSGSTATATFTVNPYLAFYNSQTGLTTFSVPTTAPTVLLIEGHGFSGTSIAANTLTITQGSTSVSTSHAAISISSTGIFGMGPNNHIVIAPSGALPLGNLAVNLGGTTFSWANGNILLCTAGSIPCGATNGLGTGPLWGGALIGSVAGSAGKGTGVGSIDSTSYMPNVGGGTAVTFFGYGFVTGAVISIAPSSAAPALNFVAQTNGAAGTCPGSANLGTWCFAAGNGGTGDDQGTAKADANGAFFGFAQLGEAASGSYTLTTTQAGGPANFISPSFSTTAWIDLSGNEQDSSQTISLDYKTTIGTAISNQEGGVGNTLNLHGFTSGAATVTLSVNGNNLATTCGAVGTNGLCTIANDGDKFSGSTLEMAGGTYNLVATDSASTAVTATFTGAVTILPLADNNGATYALYPNGQTTADTQGTTVNVRSGTDFGVHGLAPSTAYNVTWGIGAGAQVIGSFTTNSVGEIPAPGINVVLPAGTAGKHVLAIVSKGSDALFNSVTGNSAGQQTGGDTGQYGDLWVTFGTLLTASPSAISVGGTLTLAGSGLKASTLYVVTIDSPGNLKCQANTNAVTGAQYLSLTSTATGSVPAGTSVTFPALPTKAGCETGTQYNAYFSTATEYSNQQYDGYASFVLQASASFNMTSVSAGHAVTVSAKGLAPNTAYSVDFNYQVTQAGTAFTSTSIGTILGDATGSASASVVIPSGTAQGTYVVQLDSPGDNTVANVALVRPLTITVSQTASGTVGTSTFTATGTPAESTSTQGNIVSGTFTNNYGSSLSVYMWVSVMNSAGQTVGVYLGSATVASGASTNIGAALFNLPSGSYTAQVFITTTNGIVASQTSTTASFTV